MTRIYRSKGDDAKRHHLTIAVSMRLLDRLKEYAESIGRPPTAIAHDWIERGLVADDVKKRKVE